MGFLDVFRKRAPVRDPSDEPFSPVIHISGTPVRFLSPAATMTADVAQRRIPQLYRITNFVSSAVQVVPWYCEQDPSEVKMDQAQRSKVKAINSLLRSPNDTFTSQQLLYWLALNMMLYARAHFKVGVSSAGAPNGIYPLAAKYVTGQLNSRGSVEFYEYGSVESKERIPTRKTAQRRGGNQSYAAEISVPSLSGLVEYNKAPAAIESIQQPIMIINLLLQRALDTASGHANVKYVVTAEKTLTKQQRDALQAHLEGSAAGEEESGSVILLYNTVIQIHKLDNDLKDIHSKLPLDDMTRQIAGVFGVPIALMGLGSADAAKYASNYAESRLSFWQDTVVPCYLSPIAAGMTQALCPPGARIMFDLDAVPALWQGRSKLGESLTKVGFLTDNEKREILGFEPRPDMAGVSKPPPAEEPPAPSEEPEDDDAADSKVVAIHGR